MRIAWLSGLLLAAMSAAGVVAAAGDAEAGRLLAQTCMGCHGAPGMRNAYPGYHVPKLGGQHEQYIVDALTAYRDRKRSHPTMQAQAADLSNQDMADIAAYFHSMKQISQ